jgi:hypothetical protein
MLQKDTQCTGMWARGAAPLTLRRGQPAGFGRRCGVAGLVLDVFHRVDQHLGGAQIGTRRFVDHLRDYRLALGDLAAASVDRHDDRLVRRIGQERRQALGAATAGPQRVDGRHEAGHERRKGRRR